jgi:predicted GIY-YIG superfamily endonuclease
VAFWTYMLRCADARYYVGHTDALEPRLAQHEAGKGSDFTARRRPVALVWSETFSTREEALAAERQVKGWSRAKKEALIAGDWKRVSELAVSREARPSTTLRTNGVFEAGVQSGDFEADRQFPVRPEPVEGRAPSETPTP